MKAYTQSRRVIGYGPRIYVPYEYAASVKGCLNELSLWGGFDKDTGLAYAWEFPSAEKSNERFNTAKAYLIGKGFALEEYSAANQCKVWR